MSCLLNKISYHIVESVIVLIDSDNFLAQIQKIVHRFNDLKIIDRINIKRTKVLLNTTQPKINNNIKLEMSYFIKNGSTNDRPSEIKKSNNAHVWTTKSNNNECIYYRENDLPAVVSSEKFFRSWVNIIKDCHRIHDMPCKYYYDEDFTYHMYWGVHGKDYRNHYLPTIIHSSGNRLWYNVNDKLTRKVNILNDCTY